MSHHLVETFGLTYRYPDGTPGLVDISFRITHGESVAIVGATGAGKSTLLLNLNGCLLPSSGEVRIGEVPLRRDTMNEIRKKVGVIFQNPDDQLFMPRVYDDVAFGPLNQKLSPAEVDTRVRAALTAVGATHLAEKPPYHLSEGEKRLAAIASVLSMHPDILIMDEPTAGLDPKTRRSLIELFMTFKHTKIIATHDLDLVLDLCARVIILDHGRIAADGATAAIFGDAELLDRCHLEPPLRLQACPVCSRKNS